MKIRKSNEISSALQKKGFVLNPKKEHHEYYYLVVNGKKTNIYTYFSHGNKEYGKFLLSQIKKSLKFDSIEKLDQFIECTFTEENYIKMLIEKKMLK